MTGADKIAVTAATPHFPAPLKEQLTVPGKIIAPIGSSSGTMSPLRGGQDLTLLERDAGGKVLPGVSAVGTTTKYEPSFSSVIS